MSMLAGQRVPHPQRRWIPRLHPETFVTQSLEKAGAKLKIISPKAGGAGLAKGKKLAADFALNAGPSIFFDAVVLLVSEAGATALLAEAVAIDVIRDAFGHLKVIGYSSAAIPLLDKAQIDLDADDLRLVAIAGAKDATAFVARAKDGRIWKREPTLRAVF
jgi:catalase